MSKNKAHTHFRIQTHIQSYQHIHTHTSTPIPIPIFTFYRQHLETVCIKAAQGNEAFMRIMPKVEIKAQSFTWRKAVVWTQTWWGRLPNQLLYNPSTVRGMDISELFYINLSMNIYPTGESNLEFSKRRDIFFGCSRFVERKC